jgi:vitamin B12 transporter
MMFCLRRIYLTRQILRASACVAAMALSYAAHAQKIQNEPEEFDQAHYGTRISSPELDAIPIAIITVTAPALPAAKGDEAYDIVTISRNRLTNTASGRIEDALKDIAGLAQFRRTDARSANATSQGATLRGLGGNASSRALLILDGVPQTDPFGGWVTWPSFTPDRIGEIRVTRGGGAGSFGSGALAGTIEFDSVNPHALKGPEITAAYGSRNSAEASAILGGRLGSGAAFLSANYTRGDGFVPIERGQRGSADIAAPYEQASVAARAVVPLSQATELQASALAFTDRRTRGTLLTENGGDGADASIRIVNRSRWAWSALAYIQARKFQSRFVSIDAARALVLQTVDQYNVPSTGIGARVEVRPPLGDTVELRLGADWRRVTGQTNELFTFVGGRPTRGREGSGQADTIGGFAELSAELGTLTLTGGGRLDHWSIRDGRLIERTLNTGALLRNDLFPARRGTEPTGRLGLAYDARAVKLRGAAYLGWRLPTLNELYRPFRVGPDATAANAALNPERVRGVEAGFDWTLFRGANLSATAFSNRLNGAIANVTIGAGPGVFPGVGFVTAGGAYRQRQNLDAITSQGIELDARYQNGDWRFLASYALTDAKVRGAGQALDLSGLRPAQVARHAGSVTVSWQGLSVTGRYISGQFEDDLNQRRLRGAFTLDAVAAIRVNKTFAVTLRAENLSNARIDAAISSTGVVERATPRTLWLGVRVKQER